MANGRFESNRTPWNVGYKKPIDGLEALACLYAAGFSCRQVANILNVSKGRVTRAIRYAGVMRSKAAAVALGWYGSDRAATRGRLISATKVGRPGRKHTAETRAKMSAARRRAWADLDVDQRRQITLPGVVAARRKDATSIERMIESVLIALGIEYETQVAIGGRFVVDFLIRSKSLVIECDGSYWHSRPGIKEKDDRKDAYLSANGLSIVRLPEVEIRAGRSARLLVEMVS